MKFEIVRWLPTLLAALLTVPGPAASQASAPLNLVSIKEAELPNASVATTRAITRGPSVKLSTGPDVSGKSFALKVRFESRGGMKIDGSSVRMEYLKEPLVDVTDRIKPFASADALDIPVASLPAGEHHFRVSVKDAEGRLGAALITLRAR